MPNAVAAMFVSVPYHSTDMGMHSNVIKCMSNSKLAKIKEIAAIV